jgi:hypothetical protein
MPSTKETKAKPKRPTPLPRAGTKLAKLLMLLRRPQGATIEELAKATGWQKHSVRGAISGAVKKKLHQRVELLIEGNRRAYAVPKSHSTAAAITSPAKAP